MLYTNFSRKHIHILKRKRKKKEFLKSTLDAVFFLERSSLSLNKIRMHQFSVVIIIFIEVFHLLAPLRMITFYFRSLTTSFHTFKLSKLKKTKLFKMKNLIFNWCVRVSPFGWVLLLTISFLWIHLSLHNSSHLLRCILIRHSKSRTERRI